MQAISATYDIDSRHYDHAGAMMRDVREELGWTIEDVGTKLHIRTKYILAIEEGRMEDLPGKVYARGYVQSYAEFLGLNADDVLAGCFGTDEEKSPPVFQLTDNQLKDTARIKPVMLLVAVMGGILAYGLWHLADSGKKIPSGTSEHVIPESFTRHLASQWIITETNRACLSYTAHPAFPPCYPLTLGLPDDYTYGLSSVTSMMERSLYGAAR